MGIKRLLAHSFAGLLAMAATHSVVVYAGNCLWYCDDQIEWAKRQYFKEGMPPAVHCLKFDAPYKDWIYTDDSTFDKRTNSPGDYDFKAYADTVCGASCDNPALPVKATGAIQGNVLNEGKFPAYSCSMQDS